MESFQFSALHEATAIAFSPGSTFVATATQNTILVRSAKTLQVVRQWDCDTNEASGLIVIDDIKWSGNGTRLLAASKHSDCAWVLDLSCEKAIARVEAPHVRTDWGLDDIRIWTEAHTFSPDHRYMAIPERHSGKDYLGIYDSVSLVRVGDQDEFRLTAAFSDPCDRGRVPFLEPLRQVDSSRGLEALVYSPVGAKVGTYQRPSSVLGVKCVSWSPNGRHLAVGGYDGVVRVLESEYWQPISVVRGFENGALVEPSTSGLEELVHFQCAAAAHNKGATEVDQVGFSNDGKLLFFTQRRALHMYSFLPESYAATPNVTHETSVVFNREISDVRLCPTTPRFVVVNDDSMVFLCDVKVVQGARVPESRQFRPTRAIWAPDGKAVALFDQQSFCIVYEDVVGEAGEQWEEE
ncbi:hypothetical protein A1Q1_02695 [Trichosporon asahii var. asahii CBS 2479]|uniref:Anaphase-promoting complex subunit 4 WD40 domain-containing protein n=1 Tax=Trichosporon asahii var. asahii (strain ATCC 90039 / CBS 2479 / JCM 2466 / KCTC 7840 / NBRC 103889/ NCYC 2677 / UAMH 7654) TaxID=1186058 RepID=J5SYX1_TRIAS|nr:hypothetical protein A1Q1_02695 [Trichosporon asahii var. asahii CBS 2479]EJT48276.1 hypothetical protein A1Q1_02695 [Trichosporon asahii var. asahii CBS 2479]